MPWYHSGSKSAFIWSTMGIALDRTSTIRVGPLVTTPIGARYHPALIAQASATLDNLYPSRLMLAVGTGEALNETPFWHGRWPEWDERVGRLTEGIKLMRRLWESQKPFSFKGKYFSSDFYYLYTKPISKSIPFYFSAIGRKAAYFAGVFADKLLTLSPRNSIEKLEQEILPSYRKGLSRSSNGRESSTEGFVVELQFTFKSPSQLLQTRKGSLISILKNSWSVENPIIAERRAKREVTLEDVTRSFHFCKGWPDLVRLVEKYKAIGAEAVILGCKPEAKSIKFTADNLLSVF